MNFLSHYYLEAETVVTPFLLGIVLPDLCSQFNQHLKRPILYGETGHWSFFTLTVRQGVRRHIEVDRIFHNSQFFTENVEVLKQQLTSAKVPSLQYRKFFLSHIILELLIDRLLIEHFPHFLVSYYQHLHAIEYKQIEKVGEEIGAKTRLREFFGNLEEFVEKGYLWYYREIQKFAEAVVRTYCRLIRVHVDQREMKTLQREILTFEEKIADDYLSIFQYLQSQLDR